MKLSHYYNLVICKKEQVAQLTPSPLPLPQREGSEMRDTPISLESIIHNTPIN